MRAVFFFIGLYDDLVELLPRVRDWYLSLAFIGDPDISLYKENPGLLETAGLTVASTSGASIFMGMLTSSLWPPGKLGVLGHAVIPGALVPIFFAVISFLVRGRLSVWYMVIASMSWPVSVVLLPWFIPRARAWRREEIVREVMES